MRLMCVKSQQCEYAFKKKRQYKCLHDWYNMEVYINKVNGKR